MPNKDSKDSNNSNKLFQWKMAANVVVSKQGDGQYTTLADAVKNIPINHHGTYIIYIKAGVYNENVTISNSNVTLLGDGTGKTIFRSSRNSKGGFGISVSGAVGNSFCFPYS